MGNKELISYAPELYYFFDSKEFREKDFQKSISVVAKTVGQWCNYYATQLLSPLKGVKDTKKEGKLPADKKEKDIFIENLVKWIFDKSYTDDLFLLFLGVKPVLANGSIAPKNGCPKFDHHDDTCCWVLNLTEKEFRQLQKNLKKNDLPEDLFYEGSKGKCIPDKPKTFVGKFFQILGLKSYKCYTPKQWEMKLVDLKNNIKK